MQSTLYTLLFCGSDSPPHISNVINIAYFVRKVGTLNPGYAKEMVQRVADSILCTNATNALHMVPFSGILKQNFMHLTSFVFLIRARGESLRKVTPYRYLSKRDE